MGSLNDLNTFEIEPDTGAIRLVSRLNRALKSTYRLSVVAHSLAAMPAVSSTCEVNIRVERESSERTPAPSFTQPFYEFLVSETTAAVTSSGSIGQIRAFSSALDDNDDHDDDYVLEYVIDNSRSSLAGELPFRIDSLDGRIFLQRRVVKSTRAVYEFYVIARYRRSNSQNENINSSESSSIVKVKIRVRERDFS